MLLFVSASCSTTVDKRLKGNKTFYTILLSLNNSAYYFKTRPNWQNTTQNALDTFVNKWNSKALIGLREPVLRSYKGEKIGQFNWLRTFNHPVSIRVENQGEVIRLSSKVSNGPGGYELDKLLSTHLLK